MDKAIYTLIALAGSGYMLLCALPASLSADTAYRGSGRDKAPTGLTTLTEGTGLPADQLK